MRKSSLISLFTWVLLLGITLSTLPLELVQEEGLWTEVSTEEGKEQKTGEESEKEAADDDQFSDDCLAIRFKANRADSNPHWRFICHINWVNPSADIIVPPPERQA